MSNQNFKVKKGLVVATSITSSGDISSSGVVSASNIHASNFNQLSSSYLSLSQSYTPLSSSFSLVSQSFSIVSQSHSLTSQSIQNRLNTIEANVNQSLNTNSNVKFNCITSSTNISTSGFLSSSIIHVGGGSFTSASLASGGGGGGVTLDGSTTDGILTFKNVNEASVESNLKFNSQNQLNVNGEIISKVISSSDNVSVNKITSSGLIRFKTNTRDENVTLEQVLLRQNNINTLDPNIASFGGNSFFDEESSGFKFDSGRFNLFSEAKLIQQYFGTPGAFDTALVEYNPGEHRFQLGPLPNFIYSVKGGTRQKAVIPRLFFKDFGTKKNQIFRMDQTFYSSSNISNFDQTGVSIITTDVNLSLTSSFKIPISGSILNSNENASLNKSFITGSSTKFKENIEITDTIEILSQSISASFTLSKILSNNKLRLEGKISDSVLGTSDLFNTTMSIIRNTTPPKFGKIHYIETGSTTQDYMIKLKNKLNDIDNISNDYLNKSLGITANIGSFSPSGLLATSDNLKAVTGSGTSFTSELNVGDLLKITSQSVSDSFLISSIESDTKLTLASNISDGALGGSILLNSTFEVESANLQITHSHLTPSAMRFQTGSNVFGITNVGGTVQDTRVFTSSGGTVKDVFEVNTDLDRLTFDLNRNIFNNRIEIIGDITASGDISMSGGVFKGDGSGMTGITASAGGSDKFVQFNDGGDLLGGDSTFTFDKTSNVLTTPKIISSDNLVFSGSAGNPSVVGRGVYFGTTTGNTAYVRSQNADGSEIEIGSDDVILFKETDNNVTKVRFDMNTGKVGIGTTSAKNNDALLTIGGNMSSSGFISTKSHITASGNISASGALSHFNGMQVKDIVLTNILLLQNTQTDASSTTLLVLDSSTNFIKKREFNDLVGTLTVDNETLELNTGTTFNIFDRTISVKDGGIDSDAIANNAVGNSELKQNEDINLQSLTTTGNISGSSTSTGSFGHLQVGGGNFTSASLAAGGSGGTGAGFPFSGSAVISGSMLISGSNSDEPLLRVKGRVTDVTRLVLGENAPTMTFTPSVGLGTSNFSFGTNNGILSLTSTKGFNFDNAITSSGNISSSGALISTNAIINRIDRIDNAKTGVAFGDGINVINNTHITASGNISSSGTLTSNEIKGGTIQNTGSFDFPGAIVGYNVQGNNVGRQTYALTTSLAVVNSNLNVCFVAPKSGMVEIEVQIFADMRTSTGTNFVFGLSDSSTYSSIGLFQEKVVVIPTANFDGEITHKWFVKNLTPGTSYKYWLGARVTSATGNPLLAWGGNNTGQFPDFIMKATALPSNTEIGT